MFCIICNKKLTVGKRMHIGEYGLMEVEIEVHCLPCKILSRKKHELEQKINCKTIEMRGHLREYRQLKKEKDVFINQLLDLEEKIYNKTQLFYMS